MNKQTKTFRLLTVLLAAVMLVALSLNVYAASSNAVTKDGLTAQLFTDKNSYKSNEAVKATVNVTNNTGEEVFVFAAVNAPKGVTLANESAAYDVRLQNGESWSTSGGVATSAGSAATASGSTATGDNMQAALWVIITALTVCGIVAMYVYGKNKKTWISLLLCLVMIGSLGAGMVPVQAADINGDIQLSCTIQVDGKDKEISATVSYIIYDGAVEEVTDAPEASANPEATDAPEPSASPEATDAPEPSASPEPTDAPATPEDSEQVSRFGYKIVEVTDATGRREDGSYENKWLPEYSFDGSLEDEETNSLWSYDGKGSYVIYDLGETKSVGYMGLVVNYSNARITYFDIEASVDGETWFPVLTGGETPLTEEPLQMVAVDLEAFDARYIKYVGQGNSKNTINSVVEICFFPDTESGDMPLPDFTPKGYEIKEITEATGRTPDGGYENNFIPEYSYDGDLDTLWSYDGKGSYLVYDLGEVKIVDYMGLMVNYSNTRIAYYDLEASVNGETWFPVINGGETSLTEKEMEMISVDLDNIEARYFKLIGQGNAKNTVNSVMEIGFFAETRSGEMTLPQYVAVEKVIINEAVQAAIDEFEAVFDDGVIGFMADMYDPDTGAFYWAHSARANEGFLPDLESTKSIISAVNEWAPSGKTVWGDYWPKDMAATLVDWVYNLQDPDGYFYQPQWGKTVGDARRSRDLNWSIYLLDWFSPGLATKYPTPLGTASVSTFALARTAAVRSVPLYLQGEEGLYEWLEQRPWDDNPYSASNDIGACYKEIQAAGLLDELITWLDAKQNPETGFWGNGVNNRSMSAIMKLAGAYVAAGKCMNYTDKILDNLFWIIMNEEPEAITFVYNPWSGIYDLRRMIDEVGDVPAWFDEKVEANAEALIKKTTEKLLIFKKPDGGFSYLPDRSAAYSQGSLACLELFESDTNSTTVAINSIPKCVYQALGAKFTSVYDEEDLKLFIELIKQVDPVVKGGDKKSEYNFEDETLPNAVVATLAEGSSVDLVKDPKDETNQVLKFVYKGYKAVDSNATTGTNPLMKISLPDADSKEGAVVQFKFMYDGFTNWDNGGKFAITYLYQDAHKPYTMITVNDGATKGVRFYDTTTAVAQNNFKDAAGENLYLALNEWHDIKLVYTTVEQSGVTTANVDVYMDGLLVRSCTGFDGGTIADSINSIGFYGGAKDAYTLYIDDLKISEGNTGNEGDATCDQGHLYDDALDMSCNREGCDYNRTAVLDFAGATAGTALATGDNLAWTTSDNSSINSALALTLANGSSTSIVADPKNTANNVLKVVYEGYGAAGATTGSNPLMKIGLPEADAKEGAVVQFKFMYDGFTNLANSGLYTTTYLYGDKGVAYSMLGVCDKNNTEIYFYDMAAPSGRNVFKANGSTQKLAVSSWHDIKLVYTTVEQDGATTANVDVYLDDMLVRQSIGHSYTKDYTADVINALGFYGGKADAYTIYIDDLKISEGPVAACTHSNLTATEAKAETCTEAGNIAYWTCGGCNTKFSDEAGTTVVTDVTVPAKHVLVRTEAKAETCTEAGNIEHWICSREACGKKFSDEAGTTEITDVTDPNKEALGHLYEDDMDMSCNREGCDYIRTAVLDFAGATAGTTLATGDNLAWTTSDNSTINSALTLTLANGASTSIVADPKNTGNNVLKFVYEGYGAAGATTGSNPLMKIGLPEADAKEGAVVQFKFMYDGFTNLANSGLYTTTYLYGDKGVAYSMLGVCDKNNTEIYFYDMAAPSGRNVFKANGSTQKLAVSSWHDIKLVYTTVDQDGATTANVDVYLDDVLVRQSIGHSYTKDYTADAINALGFYGGKADAYTVYIDDIKISEN